MHNSSYLILILIALTACGPHSIDEFRDEGEEITRILTQELSHIHTRHELIAKITLLKRHFNELVDVMIAAQEYRLHHPQVDISELSAQHIFYSEQLRLELSRIYQIDGGCEVIEKCQEEALLKLDAYEKKILMNKMQNGQWK